MTDLELPAAPSALSHVDERGHARMVDVSAKPFTARTAVAAGRVLLGAEAFEALRDHRVRKGDALTVAQVAGVLGAKRTSDLIPLCHDVVLQAVELEFALDEAAHAVEVRAVVKTDGSTGVEMEALAAVSIAALTLYDMCKSVSKEIVVTDIRLLAKTGGQSGDYRRPA
jgi:molybdenum cofactor biosynthesis protein MoaC